MSRRTVSWKRAVPAALVAFLGISCSATDEKGNVRPTIDGIDLSSIPGDQTSLEAAIIAWDSAFRIAPQDPVVLARKDQLNAINDTLAGIVSSVEVEPGHLVKLYLSGDGRMIGEQRTVNQTSVLAGRSFGSLTDVYRMLRPQAEVPSVVAEADLRARDVHLIGAAAPELDQIPASDVPPPEDEVSKHVTTSCQHFKDDGNCPLGSSVDFPFCFCNNEGVARSNAHAATHSAWLVEVYEGSVSFRFKYNGSTRSTIAVGPLEHYGIQWLSGSGQGDTPSCPGCSAWSANCTFIPYCRKEHRGEIIAVEAPDKYHFGGCTEIDAQSPWECI